MAETTVISPYDQQQLVDRLRAGDIAAFTRIYETYTERMIGWATGRHFIVGIVVSAPLFDGVNCI